MGTVDFPVGLGGRDEWGSRFSAGRHAMDEVAEHPGDVRHRLGIRGDIGKRPGEGMIRLG